jgi:membrane dipeptidase
MSFESVFSKATVIDGLETSLWGSESVYRGLRDGGVTAINATIAIWDDFESTLANVTRQLEFLDEFSEFIRPVRSVADIDAAKAEGRTGIIFGWQNAAPIGNDLSRLRLFYELGVRIIQLTYNERNLLGNGCYERVDDGLSRFGLSAVAEMNRLGILIDLSHVGDRTTLDAIEHSETPVAVTHALARSQIDHPRNKTDEAIKNLVEHGGVIGANAFPMFFGRGFETTLEEYLDSIDYLVQMVGPRAVGIGTDFCMEQPREWFESLFASQGMIPAKEVAFTPHPYQHLVGFESPASWHRLAEGLLDRNYPEAEVQAILGGNFHRLFGEVWKS